MPIGYRESCRQPLFDGFSPRPRASCAPRAPIFPTVRPTRPTSRESTMMGLARPVVGWIGAWRSARMQPGGCSREDAARGAHGEPWRVVHGALAAGGVGSRGACRHALTRLRTMSSCRLALPPTLIIRGRVVSLRILLDPPSFHEPHEMTSD